MTVGGYLKDRAVPYAVFLASVALVVLILSVAGVGLTIVVAVGALLVVAVCAGSAWDYLAKRRFYHQLLAAGEQSGEAYYASEFIDRPSFEEGRLFYDVLEQATKDMNDRIAEYRLASEEYQEYVETWIHEVKTPLAAAHLIISNRNDVTLRSLEQEIDRTERYIEQALFYARSTAVEKDYQIRAVNLDTLVKNAAKKQSRVLIEQGITPCFSDLDHTVYGDPKWLDFVLGQIIANAAKYARPATGQQGQGQKEQKEQKEDGLRAASEEHKPQITFSAKRTEEGFESAKVILSIADSGIGIPAQDIARVFEKGFTGENGRRYAKSTGIGLYLCKKLCTRMRLHISLDSREHEGTVVRIEFPLNKMFFLESE